jgi:CRP/FNR family cyclic AMP-dependent transcriptional regulator
LQDQHWLECRAKITISKSLLTAVSKLDKKNRSKDARRCRLPLKKPRQQAKKFLRNHNPGTHEVNTLARGTKTKRKRRTKGPSDKIRSLAAISLAGKVGYLKLGDLVGQNSKSADAAIEKMSKRNFKQGDTVYPSSQKGPVVCLVRSGRVNIIRTSASGRDLDVKTVEAGTIFGDMPMLGQSMLGARAVAAEPSKVTFINAGDFEKLASASSAVALNLARQIGPRLVDAERRHEQSAFQPVTSRVASLLLKLGGGSKEVTGYTHQEMADMLGVYRETVTNGIAELKADKLIKVGRKRITMLDAAALRRMETI